MKNGNAMKMTKGSVEPLNPPFEMRIIINVYTVNQKDYNDF